ncbi:COG4705 family protein [Bradyrhizobium betae]
MKNGIELSKVPEVTLIFWIIKILATTLGETGGDAVSMSMNLGYAVSSAIFIGIFLIAVAAQIMTRKFHPFLYWFVVIATTTAGTTMADLADRSLGIGYPGGASLLFGLLMISLFVWYRSEGSISVNTVSAPRVEIFYWVSILFSQTLGTALGDWMADTNGLGYEGGALVFGAGLAAIAAAYYFTSISRTGLFWAAFILTRPLGATLGDLLDKPLANGGLAFSRYLATGILAALIVACVALLPQRAGRHPCQPEARRI